MTSPHERLQQNLAFLYGAQAAPPVFARLTELIERFRRQHPAVRYSTLAPPGLTQRDAVLIAYGDQIRQPGQAPLRMLRRFLDSFTGRLLPGLHVLPFFPSSSDEGFSVVNYREVAPDLGDWTDVEALARGRRLMVDLVLNHVSRSSAWFQAFVRQEPPYDRYFVTAEPGADLSAVVRARTHPLLTPVETAAGTKLVWTTFSADQMDLNYHNPAVLCDIVDVMLLYVAMGASMLRLDAIAYLWKEPGTPCIHLPQTHAVVRVLRAVLDAAAPGVLLVTETNVPHAENVSYFGDGTDEAHLVYNFALPPLVLDAFRRGDARDLSAWAVSLSLPSSQTAFFNFLASHDGIGVRPAEGLLPAGATDELARMVTRHGGLVSSRALPSGASVPYELNATWYDAINDPGDEADLALDRYSASQAILLALAGVPGIYFHALLGSHNWREGAATTGQARAINRQRLEWHALVAELADGTSHRGRVLRRYLALLATRSGDPCLHPAAGQQVLDLGPGIFALERHSARGRGRLLCLHNFTGQPQGVAAGRLGARSPALVDVLSGQACLRGDEVLLQPYGVAWLRETG